MQEIELAKRALQLANENLIRVIDEQVPLLLRHHTLSRPVVKLTIDKLKRELQADNAKRVTTLDTAWAFSMAEIEAIRAEYHAKESERKEQERIKREEKATLKFDETMRQYYITRKDKAPQTDGTVKIVDRKVYLPENHEYLK